MRSSPVVKVEKPTNQASRLADSLVGSQIDLLVFQLFQSLSTNTLPRQAPLPSMAMPLSARTPVKAAVNCEPWSVLKISENVRSPPLEEVEFLSDAWLIGYVKV
jgi:hypothetical protein